MDSRPTLLCTVRDCRSALIREESRLVCPQRHSFDIARSGYINLLQPQDRRSKNPGDTVHAVGARRRLHDLGATESLLQGVAAFLQPSALDVVLDAGCGEGFYLGSLARRAGFAAHGVDISVPAIEAAARRYPGCHWIVANADRFLPFGNHSFSMVLSITARMNPTEFQRILQPQGRLLIALPAPDDLIELRGLGRDRIARTVDEFAPSFKLLQQHRVTTTVALDALGVADVLLSIYRPLQTQPPQAMSVTFSLDFLLFEARKSD